ncbi:MAG: riboflavin biosynthesis protein RibD [Nitrosomonadales bacterium]|nr:riboflavin biosynthesis protein RibD [Nitrosomonadales bacterium]
MDDKLNFKFMAKALALAKRSLGRTRPNPSVGAIIVKNKKIVGKGFHKIAGKDHAEIIAIKEAGLLAKGADLYVTLEPCSHKGKTPPCANSIVSSGIKNIYIAMTDPNPLVNGKGVDFLKKNGMNVFLGIMEEEAKKLNLGFISRMKYKRPYIRSKIAISLDGKTSLQNGKSRWITSKSSREDVQKWRSKSCAILTGKGTINIDNPSLLVKDQSAKNQPLRIILDSYLTIKPNSKILQQNNVVVVYGEDSNLNLPKLKKTKAKLEKITLLNNKIDLMALMQFLNKLEINDLWVEAGPKLNGELLKLELLDELITYMAPYIIGGNANSMFDAPILKNMSDKIKFTIIDFRNIGEDIRIQAKLDKNYVD